MPRGEKDAKPAKAKVEAELAAVRKLLKSEASRRRQKRARTTSPSSESVGPRDVFAQDSPAS